MIPLPSESLPAEERSKNLVNLRWLVRVRWMSLLAQIGITCFGYHWGGLDFPCTQLMMVFGLGLFSNAALHFWASRLALAGRRGPEELQAIFGVTILLDTSLLTLVLALTGGPSNPFTVLYLVHIVLSTILLPSLWSTLISIVSVGAFLGLFYWHVEIPGLSMHGPQHQPHLQSGSHDDSNPGTHVRHRDAHTREAPGEHQHSAPRVVGAAEADHAHDAHLWGMFMAFAFAAGFITWYVQRIMGDLGRLTVKFEVEQQRRADAERLRSLGTLAAGAAHELATPLSTVRIIASELKRALESPDINLEMAAGDLREMLDELDRCTRILEQMRASSGEVGVSIDRVNASTLVDVCLDGLPSGERVDARVDSNGDADLPLDGIAHAVRSVLSNALQSGPGRVAMRVGIDDAYLDVRVQDVGSGMNAQTLARFTEPFFTTRPEGAGMGLGAYLARRVVEDLGGTFVVDSAPGTGTRIEMRVPLHSMTR
jgi:two-component system sensor histidine kinase RegB